MQHEDLFTEALKRQLLTLHGIAEDATPFDVFQNQNTKIDALTEELERLKKPPVSSRWVVDLLLENRRFTPQQKRLLKALASGRPRKEFDLIRLCEISSSPAAGTQAKKQASLRRLVARINQAFQNQADLKSIFKVVALNGQPFNGYILNINAHELGLSIE